MTLQDPRSKNWLQYLPLLVNLSLTIGLGASLNIWHDEAFSLHTTDGSPLRAITQAINFELQPPLYFLLLNLWRQLNSSPFFARLFSILCIALTLALMTRVARRLFPSIHPFWPSAFLAANQFLIWAAVEIRCYALVLCLSAILFSFFLDAYLEDPPRKSSQWYYMLFSLLSLYTQYYLGFLLVAHFLALLAIKRWSASRAYLLDMLWVVLGAIPLFLLVPQHVASHTGPVVPLQAALGDIRLAWWRVSYYILPDIPELLPPTLRAARSYLVLLLLIFLLVFGIIRFRRLLNPIPVAVVTILVFLTATYLLLCKFVGPDLTEVRHTAFLFLPASFAFLTVVVTLLGRKGIIASTTIILAFNLFMLQMRYSPPAKQGDWKHVAKYLMASENSNQPVLIFRSQQALPLSYHYSGKNTLVPIPRELNFEKWDLKDLSLNDEEEVLEAIRRVPGQHSEFWLVTDGVVQYLGVRFHPELLEKVIADFFTVESVKRFPDTQVRLLRLRRAF